MTHNIALDNFLNQLSEGKQYKQILKKATKQYDILRYKVKDLTIHQIKNLYTKILRFYSQKKNVNDQNEPQNEEPYWIINELKCFVWIAVCYAGFYHQHLSSLNQQSLHFLVSVFYFKPLEILQFQLLLLTKGYALKTERKWSKAQDELLLNILKDHKLQGKWNQISKQFFIQSEKKYFRKPQKCREHWFNHLSPSISHKPWSLEEDLALIQNVSIKGKKWAQISQSIGGQRTQHMVKNRYKSLQKKHESQILKSQKKILNAAMIINSVKILNQQTQKSELKKTESSRTYDQKTKVNLTGVQFPTKVDELSMEQEYQQMMQISNLKSCRELNLIQVSEENFFTNQKKSMDMMSQFDDDIQKYVEAFLF